MKTKLYKNAMLLALATALSFTTVGIASAKEIAESSNNSNITVENNDKNDGTDLYLNTSLFSEMPPSTTTHIDNHPGPIVIDGKVFGEKEGLTKVVITGVLSAGDSHSTFASPTIFASPTALAPRGWAPYYNTTISWGSSWVRNQEIGYLLYRGSTQAGGNIYQGKRIIQTTLKYKRNGSIIGSATSDAKYQSNRWNAGSVAYTRTWDSLKPNAPETQFYYSYYSVNPNVTG